MTSSTTFFWPSLQDQIWISPLWTRASIISIRKQLVIPYVLWCQYLTLGMYSLICCFIAVFAVLMIKTDNNILKLKKNQRSKSEGHFYVICINSTVFCIVDNWPVFNTSFNTFFELKKLIMWLNIISTYEPRTLKMKGNIVCYTLLSC